MCPRHSLTNRHSIEMSWAFVGRNGWSGAAALSTADIARCWGEAAMAPRGSAAAAAAVWHGGPRATLNALINRQAAAAASRPAAAARPWLAAYHAHQNLRLLSQSLIHNRASEITDPYSGQRIDLNFLD
jgi:ethanolamine ammonia-lyase small subunit